MILWEYQKRNTSWKPTKLNSKFRNSGFHFLRTLSTFSIKCLIKNGTSNELGVILYTGDTLENCKVGFPGDYVCEENGIYWIENVEWKVCQFHFDKLFGRRSQKLSRCCCHKSRRDNSAANSFDRKTQSLDGVIDDQIQKVLWRLLSYQPSLEGDYNG